MFRPNQGFSTRIFVWCPMFVKPLPRVPRDWSSRSDGLSEMALRSAQSARDTPSGALATGSFVFFTHTYIHIYMTLSDAPNGNDLGQVGAYCRRLLVYEKLQRSSQQPCRGRVFYATRGVLACHSLFQPRDDHPQKKLS